MRSLTVMQQKLLGYLVDDSFDLFEVVSLVGSEMRDTSAANHVSAAKDVVRSLLAEQLASAWILPSIGASEVPLPLNRVPGMFASDADWVVPVEEGPRIRLLATARGRAAYYAGGTPRQDSAP